MTNVLVCVKRVPGSSGQLLLAEDALSVDARHVGHTIGPHEECAVEAAVQVVSAHGGTATVLTVGPAAAVEQLRDALAMGVGSAVHVETADGAEDGYGPADVAAAIASVVSGAAVAPGFDLVLVGNDAADTGDFQVGIRVAYALGWPVVTGVRSFTVEPGPDGDVVHASADGPAGSEEFEVPLPAVLTITEGEISPRYPSIPGRLKARRAPVQVIAAEPPRQGTARRRLVLPPEQPSVVRILGTGAEAAPAVVALLDELGLLAGVGGGSR